MAKQQKQKGGGSRKLGRDKAKCEKYRREHGGGARKKIVGSKRQRGCTPLGYIASGRPRPLTWQELNFRLRQAEKAAQAAD